MTALASWCKGDNWLDDLPVDEAVPMLFRMGVEQNQFRSQLAAGARFSARPCQASVGVSTDEPLAQLQPVQRLYVFNPEPWSATSAQPFDGDLSAMRATLPRSIFAIVLLATILCQTPLSLACGPFTMSAVFTFTKHPEYPLANFARGELGVVQPSFARSYLYVAYRYFGGGGFTSTEQQALVDLWSDRLNLRWDPTDGGELQEWLSARKKVLAGAEPKIDAYRNREKPNEYESYLNCQMDAFESATKTLEARTKQLGAESAALKQWVEAQDQVFANCSEGQHIPAALPADADAQLRADRDYQIAAANFYAGNFDLARTQFESIAGSQSPWRSIAPYLVARTLVRKASLGPDETKKAALAEAEKQLNTILTKADLQSSHAAAKRLLNIVRLRLHPEDRLHELALSLASKAEQATLKQDLWDYTLLLDDFLGDDTHHQKPAAGRGPAWR